MLSPESSTEICATTLLRGGLQNFSLARAMPPKKAEEAAAPPAADDDGLAELATRALPPAFDDDALAALAIGKAGGGSGRAGRRCSDLALSSS